MAILEIEGLCKGYGDGAARTEVLHEVNLTIEPGEFVAIVGFSGSGKTTLVSAIAGLLAPDSGEIRVKGQRVTSAGHDRGIVFQSYSLMPWLTVQGNIALAVDAVFPKWSRQQRREQVAKYIELVGLSHAADRRPAQLSGGMRQRVAVARALAMQPEILLLDEPLSALDALTRSRLQDEIESLWRNERKTVVMVTNDVDEALLLADRIIPLTPAPAPRLAARSACRRRGRGIVTRPITTPSTGACAPRSLNTSSTPGTSARSRRTAACGCRTSFRSHPATSCPRPCARRIARKWRPTSTSSANSTKSPRHTRRRRAR
jgi:ABC-type nitrate/sulfonate/bicarbonate transport system ATPase subunit